MSSALFATPSRATTKNLVEFRAGKMTMTGKTVTADKRRGLVYVYQSDDGLMHFCWKDRKTSRLEINLLIFPDDVEFKRVGQCTTGRVYILKFKSSTRKYFFWMQEPKSDKDDDYCSKVNETLNNPPLPGSSRSNVSTPSALPSDLSGLMSAESELQSLLSGMSQQQLISLLSGNSSAASLSGLLGNRRGNSTRTRNYTTADASFPATPAAAADTAPAAAASTPAAPTKGAGGAGGGATTAAAAAGGGGGASAEPAGGAGIKVSDLRSILSNMNVPEDVDSVETPAPAPATGVNLATAMTAETLQPILCNAEFVRRLQQFLPSINSSEQLPDVEQLRGTLQSPHFQQALSVFSSALQSGQLAPLVRQFELGDEAVAAAVAGDLEQFVRALQNKQQQPGSDKKQ